MLSHMASTIFTATLLFVMLGSSSDALHHCCYGVRTSSDQDACPKILVSL